LRQILVGPLSQRQGRRSSPDGPYGKRPPPFGRIAVSVIGAAIDDEALEVAARAFWVERRAVAGSIIERAVARRELLVNGLVDMLMELLVGPIYYRWLVIFP
jgi:hypothetical protein